MAVRLANNAVSLLAASITDTATSLSIQAADAGKFPTLADGEWHPATIVDAANNMEIVRVTARAGNVLTVVRAQEATTAKAFVSGSRIDVRLTAGVVNDIYSSHYTKTEIDSAFSGYYTKSQIDVSFAGYYTKTQIDSTVDGLSTGINGKVSKTGDTMSDVLTLQKLVNAFWAGLRVRNSGTGDAAMQAAAANRDFSSGVHVEFGQRANGNGYLWVVGKQWVMNSSGDMSLPNNGILYGTGDLFCSFSGLNTTLSTIIGRMRNVRLTAEATNNVNRSGWNIAPNGAYVTGVYKDGAGEIMNYAYRYMQQTDLFGNWVTVPTL